ncbi:Ig-like domain-containing protein [Mangrovimonas xylaniphaga]|uniref:Ig-like domain-containing protein n=1 Tax=Mangrovimonas xylaniphaga TaxID=1645915 RepID=UPI0006B54B15|nr:Ig-like domain-containing protein [Mangrovimonas xylaniphaga]
MLQKCFKTLVVFTVILSIVGCANRGTPTGGEKDVDPPKIVKSVPENFSTNFKASEIRIYFDEYIKVKNMQKQLIISPPMEYQPDITPLGSASKYIKIKIKDTLQPNTTYAFNFGQSIVDNNEENPYPYYKYVFSTGTYIDSLSVKGLILDAENKEPDTFVSVMLYEMDSTYTDSVVYKKKPKYVTNTLDSLTTFSLENLKEGEYMMVALNDKNGNFTFEPKVDKIGFHRGVVKVPNDTIYTLKLFSEELDFRAIKPKQIAGEKIAFGYEGNAKNMKIDLLEETPSDYETRITKDAKADTLYYWYKPKMEMDSARFVVRNYKYTDTLIHKYRELERDSLEVKPLKSGTISFNEDFAIEGTTPFVNIDEQKIKIIDKDTLEVAYKTEFDTLKNIYTFKFDKTESNSYNIEMLPEALTGFFGHVNDTLNFNVKTKNYTDYSNMRVTLQNAKFPVIVQLTTEKGEVKYEQFATENRVFDFRFIEPVNYYLRVIFDTNGNQKWDTGSYLQKRQPERISYYPELIKDARANWDPIIEFPLLD